MGRAEDGLALQEWVRKQSFYNGELYLLGRSYASTVHYVTAPFAPDIKGAVFGIKDSERYNIVYRNGFLKTGLHGRWFAKNYKQKSMPKKPYVHESFFTIPLKDFTRVVIGEAVPSFDELLKHPDKNDPFWETRFGGGEARGRPTTRVSPFSFSRVTTISLRTACLICGAALT
jgi:predicted acyl esterase